MDFRVPQYIDVEDKIFGSFSVVQFVFLAGGGGLIFLLWRILPHFIAVLFIIPIAALTWALVFYPKQRFGKSFAGILESAFRFYSHSRLYTWKKEKRKIEMGRDLTTTRPAATPSFSLPAVSEDKLTGLSTNIEVVDPNAIPEESKHHAR